MNELLLKYESIEKNIKKKKSYHYEDFLVPYQILFENVNSFPKFPLEVGVKITSNCNLQCLYCSNSQIKSPRDLNSDRISLTHEDFLELFSYLTKNKIISHITGGEPFLNIHLMDYIQVLANSKIPFKLFTNGMFLDDLIIKRISQVTKDSRFAIQISLDGSKKIHNYLRKSKTSFDKIIKSIRLLKKYGIFVKINCVISKYNYTSIKDLMLLCNQLKINDLSLTPVFTTPDFQHLLVDEKFVAKSFIDAMVFYNQHNFSFDITQTPIACTPNLGAMKAFVKCPAGIVTCDINEYGDVYPCPFLNIPPFHYGNLKFHSLEEIWKKNCWDSFRFRKHTPKCDLVSCNGLCPASSYFAFGDIFGCDLRCKHTNQFLAFK